MLHPVAAENLGLAIVQLDRNRNNQRFARVAKPLMHAGIQIHQLSHMIQLLLSVQKCFVIKFLHGSLSNADDVSHNRLSPIILVFGIMKRMNCFCNLEILPMRLDKYLKVSRLVKRRTVAAELCQGGHVKINGQTAKPAAEVKPGQTLELRFGNRLLTVKIAQTPEKAVPAQLADTLYEIVQEIQLQTSPRENPL